MSRNVSLKITDEDAIFLEKLAEQHNLKKANGHPSVGKMIKRLVEKARIASSDEADTSALLTRMNHLLEEVHVMIPHMLLHGVFNAKLLSSSLGDQDYSTLLKEAVANTTKICGSLQNQKYKKIHIAYDQKNMKTIPINEDENQWK